ncbi:MAG: holo-[acyl-carrier-protein] synthase [bacterium]|nr:holo-[acyl-carrier-protein] synthase [bacterium]
MGIIGLGIDVVEKERVRDVYTRFGERFLRRILCDDEIAYCMKRVDPVDCIAARFAAKEATYKALGPTPDEIIPFRDIEIKMDRRRPEIAMYNRSKEFADKMGVTNTLVSISHDGGIAVAIVVLSND